MINISDEFCGEYQKHPVFSVMFLKNCAVYEIMWKDNYSRKGHR